MRLELAVPCLLMLLAASAAMAAPLSDLEKLFDAPPATFRRLPIHHELAHELTPEQLQKLKEDHPNFYPEKATAEGIGKKLTALQYEKAGGAVLNVAWGANYLRSDIDWKNLDTALQGMEDRGMTAWIYDEHTYPSGFAGGLTYDGHPEFLPAGIAFDKIDPATLSGEWTLPTGEPLLIAAAKRAGEGIDPTTLVDLTSQAKESKLRWESRPGDWLLMAFVVQRGIYKGTHAEYTHHPYVNIMDPRAIKHFLEVTHDAYYNKVGSHFGKTIKAFFTDEPSLMTGYLGNDDQYPVALAPWSDDFPARFEKEHSYPLTRALPAIFLDAGADTSHYRCDFWGSVGHAVSQAFFGQIQEWCLAHGVLSSGHPLWEESLLFHVPFYGNLYECLTRMDMPGMDLLGSEPGHSAGASYEGGPVTPKLISSTAHLMGRTRTMTESYCLTRDPDFEKVIGVMNWQEVLGINSIATYSINESFTHKQYEELNTLAGRLGALATQGRHVCDVAVLYPITAIQADYKPTRRHVSHRDDNPEAMAADDTYVAISRTLLENQRDFDYIDDDLFAKAVLRKGRLEIAGESFAVVVVPPMRVIRLDTLKRLEGFAREGGQVIFVGLLPEESVEWGKSAEVRKLAGALVQSGHARKIDSDNPSLNAAWRKLPADLSTTEPMPTILALHRQVDAGSTREYNIYLIVNNSAEPVSGELAFRAKGTPRLWWPRTGKKEEFPESWRKTEKLSLALSGYSSVFVIFDAPETGSSGS